MTQLYYLFFAVLLCPLSSYAFAHLSPYSYCGGDPVNRIDPTGCVIEGVTKKDAALAVKDFRAMFPGEEFSNFRNLIVQSSGFVTNRPATLGHEIIGHEIIGHVYARSLGYADPQSQHILPIQVENLILRNMGSPLFRDGTDHAPLRIFIPNYMSLPNF